jgi:hypothetical protein
VTGVQTCALPIYSSSFRSIFSLRSISFSNNLFIMDSKLIGRYEDNSFGSFPGFGIKIISAVFNCFGLRILSKKTVHIISSVIV